MVGSTFFGLDISQVATRLLSLRRRISKRVLLLEYGPDFLRLGEATLTQTGVKLSHISSFALSPEELDRGVPADPLKMAGRIKDFCDAKKIPAHRAAVVLPPELAFQRLLDLPASLTTDEARDYVLNPANGLQIPFPLMQTDFDLFPVSTPAAQSQNRDKNLYMLTAIPEVLVDSIVETFQAADLELQLLELGSHSQLRNCAADLITLAPRQVDLVLELLPDSSNLMLISCSGLLGSERLASIRNLPELNIASDQITVALESGLTAEQLVCKDDNYLPISELDLRVLVADLRASLERFHHKLPGAEIRHLILTGVNSSHPFLADLLAEMLGLQVVVSQSDSVNGLAELSMDDLLPQSGLGRLIGLALGLLPNDQLLTCSLEDSASKRQQSQSKKEAVAIADLLIASGAQTGLDLVALEAGDDDDLVAVEEMQDDPIFVTDTDIEVAPPLESTVFSAVDSRTKAAEQAEILSVIPVEVVEDQETTSSSKTLSNLELEPLQIDLGETHPDAPFEHEDPSSSSPKADLLPDAGTADDADSHDSQWSSIKAPVSGGRDQRPHTTVHDSPEFSQPKKPMPQDAISSANEAPFPDRECSSISSVEPDVQGLEIHLEAEVEDDPSRWPSVASEQRQASTDSSLVFENIGDLLSTDEVNSDEINSHQTTESIALETTADPQKLSHETSDSSSSIYNPTAHQPEGCSIPGLRLSEDALHYDELSKDEASAKDNDSPIDIPNELGELRFADED